MVFDEDEAQRHNEVYIDSWQQNRSPRVVAQTPQKLRVVSAHAAHSAADGGLSWAVVAKDTEKLIRQLSLISYLMAERRPVTATEIRRDVEGYSDMTEDAFARRFYADRAELDSLGIHLSVDRPADGFSEQENYSLAPEAFFLPAVEFTDAELAALQTALSLLDGEFAYAEPLRLALQQLTWGRPSSLGTAQRVLALGSTGSAGGDLSARLTKIDTAIQRRKRIEFEYYTMQSGETALRKVDPYLLLFEAGEFYLVGHAHERGDVRVFRLSRIRGKVAYATKAEHDFQRPEDFNPHEYANRPDWQLGDEVGTAELWISDRMAWRVRRKHAPDGDFRPVDDGEVFTTRYASARLLVGWAIGYGHDVRVLEPPELRDELHERLDRVAELHRGEPFTSVDAGRPPVETEPERETPARQREAAGIRPERFARLVTLASRLIQAGRSGERLDAQALCAELQISPQELREDVAVLNVVNFGGGAYVLYAEVLPSGEIEVDTEPYSDTFDRPARLLPVEARALMGAIDLLDVRLSEHLQTAREKLERALGDVANEGLLISNASADDEIARPVGEAIESRRLIEFVYWSEYDDEFSTRVAEPYALPNSPEAWYVRAYDLGKDNLQDFRLDRIKEITVLDQTYAPRDLDGIARVQGWQRTGEIEGSRIAHVWIAPQHARRQAEKHQVLAELPDGAIIVAWPFKGPNYLVKSILTEAGDAAVLEPADVREDVLAAAERLLAPSPR
jgi:proteasome accessory factor C